MKPLETERLLLRHFANADMPIHSVVFSDPEVCRYYCGSTRTPEQTREWLVFRKLQAQSDDGLGALAVVRREDRQLLGLVALQLCVAYWLVLEEAPHSVFHPLTVELSYAFGRAYQHQGYATEACRALIEYGFTEMRLPRLINGIVVENGPSVRLVERLGFRRETNLKNHRPVWVLDNDRI